MPRPNAYGPTTSTAPSVAPLPTRPACPAHLPAAAAKIWRETINARPASYFDAGSIALLECFSRAMAEYRRIMRIVEATDPLDDAFARLTRIADTHAGRVSQLATRMRLSQQSKVDARAASRKTGDFRSPIDRMRENYGVA